MKKIIGVKLKKKQINQENNSKQKQIAIQKLSTKFENKFQKSND
jgi:hypothetical protein